MRRQFRTRLAARFGRRDPPPPQSPRSISTRRRGAAEREAARVVVHVEPLPAGEADEGHPELPGEVHREARRGADGADDRNPRHEGLLHDLEAPAPAHLEDRVRERDGVPEDLLADDLVDGVVAAHVLPDADDLPVGGEEARRVEAARLREDRLGLPEPRGQGPPGGPGGPGPGRGRGEPGTGSPPSPPSPPDAFPIRAMSSSPRTIPSVNRKPAASSKSSPGVRIVTDRLRVKTPSSWGIARRISIGSWPAPPRAVGPARAPHT